MKALLLSLVVLVVTSSAPNVFAASTVVRSALPPNNLHLLDDVNRVENIDEKMFNQVIDQVAAVFSPMVTAHGGNLVMEKNWKDSTVNAFASQSGKTWKVAMFGGLARRPEVTPDGFAMVVCHELGHHLAGYAFYGQTDWASAEGNSDYWATQVCARKLWSTTARQNHELAHKAPSTAQKGCDLAWKETADRERCYRTANAGFSLANLLGAIGDRKAPSFDTPDQSVVSTTVTSHPKAQCRLDTYFHGALCTKAFDLSIIPGRNNPKGQVSPEAEAEAAKYSCMKADGSTFGYRPACWFKPLVGHRLASETL